MEKKTLIEAHNPRSLFNCLFAGLHCKSCETGHVGLKETDGARGTSLLKYVKLLKYPFYILKLFLFNRLNYIESLFLVNFFVVFDQNFIFF